MPFVHVYMVTGRTADQKRRLTTAITKALVEEAGATVEDVSIILHDTQPSDWSEGGLLLNEKKR